MNGRPGAVVVGTGFGGRVHVPALRAAGFEVLALVGRDPDRTARRAARLEVPVALVDLESALALPGVVAVTIATPPATHADVTLAALAAVKHVLCEKPFAADAGEAEAMRAAAEHLGVTALVGHEFRWAPDRAVAARAIGEGAIGEPRVATFVSYVPLVADPTARVPGWWFDPAAGGGWLGASGSHLVDQLRLWLGEVVAVRAALTATSARTSEGKAGAEDTFTVHATLASGCEAVLQQTAGAWGELTGMTRVAGTRGTLWLEAEAAWLADAAGTRRLPVPDELSLPDVAVPSHDPRHRFTYLELAAYTRLCEALRAAADGQPMPTAVPLPTFADGVAVTRVLDAIRTSAAHGGARIEVPPHG